MSVVRDYFYITKKTTKAALQASEWHFQLIIGRSNAVYVIYTVPV